MSPTDSTAQEPAPGLSFVSPEVTGIEPLKQVKRVVFFGSFGPPALTFARSCRSMGISTYLLSPGSEKNPSALQQACFSGFRTIDPGSIGKDSGIEAVLAYVTEVGADALTTLSQTHRVWFATNAARFESICKLMIPSVRCLELAESKTAQAQLARETGFSTLPTYVIHGANNVADIDGSHYPLCLRPAAADAATPTFKAKVVETPQELSAFVNAMRISGDGLIAQPFRVLPNAVLHCTSNENGDLLNAKAFLVDRKFEGLSLRMRPMPLPEELASRIAAFARAMDASGPYHFDFLYSSETDEWFYLEVNVRFGGTTDKVIWFGVDEAENCFLAYGLKVPHPPRSFSTRRKSVVNKRAIVKHIVTMLRHRPDPLDYPVESRSRAIIRSVGDLFFAKDSMVDFGDIKGTMAFYLREFSR